MGKTFKELEADFPDDMEVILGYDATDYVRRCIREIVDTLIITFVLVVLVCYLFLQDWRADNIVESVGYAYDALGRPVGRNGDTFGYNDRGEGTNATIAGRTELHADDEIGNSTGWAANSLNQYAQFAYDPDGNLLSDGVRNLLLRRLEPRRGARRLRERKDYYACRFHLPALI